MTYVVASQEDCLASPRSGAEEKVEGLGAANEDCGAGGRFHTKWARSTRAPTYCGESRGCASLNILVPHTLPGATVQSICGPACPFGNIRN